MHLTSCDIIVRSHVYVLLHVCDLRYTPDILQPYIKMVDIIICVGSELAQTINHKYTVRLVWTNHLPGFML